MADRPVRKKPTQNSVARNRKRKNNFAIFYAITMIIGVVVCVTLFALAYQTLVPPRITGYTPPPTQNNPSEFVRQERETVTGMVTALNTLGSGSISLHLLDSGRSNQFNMTNTTSIQDRRGQPIGFAELHLGQIVDVTYDVNTRDMSAIALNVRAWEQQPSSFGINLENATVTIGNRVYTYSSRTLVLNRGEPFSIPLINPEDIITMVGIDDKIWSIRIDSGHGFIHFYNTDRVIGGTVTIGNTIHTALDDDRPIAVVEGVHRVIVNGQNIDTFVAYVVVNQGQTVAVNLVETALRYGTVQLLLYPPDAAVFINGEPAELDGNIVELEYSTHLLRVEAPGYIPIQQEFDLYQPFLRLEIELERDITGASILIQTFPSDAQVFINDAFVGHSPITVEIEFGNNTIIARRAGYEDRHHHIWVDETSPREFLLPMTQLPMHLPAVSPIPPGGQPHLPPMQPGVTPIPSPTIPPPWPETQTWPPAPEDLPLPEGY